MEVVPTFLFTSTEHKGDFDLWANSQSLVAWSSASPTLGNHGAVMKRLVMNKGGFASTKE